MRIDKIYVIALDHSQDRLDSIIERMGKLGLENRISYEIVQAHHGFRDPLPSNYGIYQGWDLGDSTWNDWWQRPVLPGEVGCAVSHHQVWQKIVASDKDERALVLEEDFNPIKTLASIDESHISDPWDILFLGRYVFDVDGEEQLNDQICVPGQSYNAHAYVLTTNGARKLLSYKQFESNLIPVDEFLPATWLSHRRPDVEAMYPNKTIKAISTNEDWISQTSNRKTSTTENIHNMQIENETYFEILDTSDWDAWLDKYVNQTIRNGEYDLIVDEIDNTNILEFPLFTEKFCQEAVALSEAKDKWTYDRHEFYPTNDVLLHEIGLDEAYNRVLREVVYPLCIHWWHLEGKGWREMVSENFLARYTTDRQSHLALHHDFSHITMVLKLNDEFSGGGTWFPKYKVLSNPERVGTATLHPGLVTHLHGARPITAGKRYITVSFMRKEK